MELILINPWNPVGPLTLNKYFDHLPKNASQSNSTHFDSLDISPTENFENLYLSSGFILAFYIIISVKKFQNWSFFENPGTQDLKFRLVRNHLLYFLVSLVFLPFVLAILFFYVVYRAVISLVLRIQYVREFKGLFEGPESVWAIEDVSKCVITIKIWLECPKTVDIYQKLQEMFKILCKKHKKFTYLREKQYGYYFWREKTIEFEKYIRKIDSNCEKPLQEYCNEDMPLENRGTWEILIGKTEFSSNETKLVPLIFRVHHCLADGISLVAFLLQSLGDRPTLGAQISQKRPSKFKKTFKNLFLYIYASLFGLGFALHQFLIRKKDQNILHGPKLSGEKVIELFSEAQSVVFEKILASKKALGATFTEIMLTAISEAFGQHFKEKDAEVPDFLTIVLPVYMGDLNFFSGNLENDFSLVMLNLPIKIYGSFLERLQKVQLETQYLKHAPDAKINYVFCKVPPKYFPVSAIQYFLEQQSSTCTISNVPGPKKELSILVGCKIKDILFWTPNRGQTALGISIFSYCNRLRLGLLADKAVVKNNEEAQQILQNIVSAIQKMYEGQALLTKMN